MQTVPNQPVPNQGATIVVEGQTVPAPTSLGQTAPTTMPVWTPAEAKAAIEGRTPRPVTFRPKPAAAASGLSPALSTLDSNTDLGVASIAELARALNNDPNLIYQFVHDNISYYPIYGVHKGAYGALLDGSGTDFDQAMLMVALLRQAGFTANYVLGQIQLNAIQTSAWLGCKTDSNNGGFIPSNILGMGGIPNSYTLLPDGSLDLLTLTHCWVQVNIGGTLYVYDPSLKTRTLKTGIDLVAATGYNRADVLTAAETGATIDPNNQWIQNFNQTAVNTKLTTYANNLVSYIKTNMPTATMDDIIGGSQIVPATIPLNQTALPYEVPGDVPTIWTGDVPDNYKVSVQLLGSVSATFTSDQLCGRRLGIYDNPGAPGTPALYLDGVIVGTGTSYSQVGVYIKHNAYPNTSNDSFFTSVFSNGYIGLGFGMAGRGALDVQRKALDAAVTNGVPSTSEPYFGAVNAILWYNYYANEARTAAMLDGVHYTTGGVFTIIHQSNAILGAGGLSLAQAAPVIDGGPTYFSFCYLNTSIPWALPQAGAFNMRLEGLEALNFQQLTGTTSLSAVTEIGVANAAGYKLFYPTLDAANLNAIKAQLVGYPANDLSRLGNNMMFSQQGPITVNNWVGNAWLTVIPGGFGGVISPGNLNGGISTKRGPIVSQLQNLHWKKPCTCSGGGGGPHIMIIPSCWEVPPVEDPPIGVGGGAPPYKLRLKTSYSQTDYAELGPLGLGWTHNFVSTATVSSDGPRGLGEQSPIEAAAAIVAGYAEIDFCSIVNTQYDITTVGVCALIENWAIGQLSLNTVAINLGDQRSIFYKLADGSYYSQDDVSTLTLSGGLFVYTTPQQVKYNFNASGQLSTIVYPFGVTVTLTYTAGLLTSITNGLGRTLTLSYTGNFLTTVSDGTGRSVSYLVDVNGNLTQYTDPNGNVTKYVYGLPGQLTQVFYPQNPLVAAITYGYDTIGNLQTIADIYGHTWTYFYAGSRSRIQDPNGNSKLWYLNDDGEPTSYTDELGNTTTYTYDGLGRLASRTEPEGNSTSWTFDGKNNVLTETKVPKAGSGLTNVVFTWTYDATYNKVHTLLDGRSNTWTWNYDPATSNLLSFVKPVVNGQTPQETWSYNGRGQVLLYTDETGIVTQFNYDTLTEKLNSVVVDLGVAPHLNLTTNYGYDAAGNVTKVTDPNNNQTVITLDPGLRVTQVTAPAPFSYVTKYGYDQNNNLTTIQRQVTSTPTYQTYMIGYTLSDQVHTVTDPASNVTTKTYDTMDRLSTITDAAGRVSTFFYDAMSRPSSGLDALGDTTDVRTYSNNGLLASIKDANGNQTQYTYDGFDRPDKTIYPDTSFEENQSYDGNDNLLTYRTRSGKTIVDTYDALNRLSTKSPTGQAVVTFGYDLSGRLLSASTPVVSGNPASGNFQFAYDTAGRLKQETTPDSKNTQYQRDGNGNVTVFTYPDGYFLTRVYDQLNRLTDIKLNGAGSAAIHIDYDQLSRRSLLTYGNTATSAYTFQINDDLTSLVESFVGSAVTFTYGFNKVHQRTNRVSTDVTYDWHPSATANVSYGAATSVNTYPTVGGVTYSYDGNANLTSDGVWTYVYDTENHLLTANKTGVSASYVYDPSHRQIQKTVGATKSLYVYSGWQRIADYDGTAGTLQNRYVYGDDLDEPLIQVSSAGVLTYMHADALGSVIATTNAAGSVTNKNKYSPYGENAPAGTTFGFTGQRYDAETGLYFYKNRYYSPAIGRFLQTDPIGYGDGLNLYEYVHSDPVNSSDPLGLSEVVEYNLIIAFLLALMRLMIELEEQKAKRGKTCCANENRRKVRIELNGDYGGYGTQASNLSQQVIGGGLGVTLTGAVDVIASTNPLVAAAELTSVAATGQTIGRRLGQGTSFTSKIPILTVRESEMPLTAENIAHAQAAGWPPVLTYLKGGTSRYQVMKGIPSFGRQLWRDEYPFITTMEGGRGSWVGIVPADEQGIQAGQWSSFILQTNLKTGDKFYVGVVKK